jgi:hypothetical protein
MPPVCPDMPIHEIIGRVEFFGKVQYNVHDTTPFVYTVERGMEEKSNAFFFDCLKLCQQNGEKSMDTGDR